MKLFSSLKDKVTLDADTYALFLEGWDNKHNVTKARNTFGEIIFRIGWLSSNKMAYNAFLGTLINRSEMEEALCVMAAMKTSKCLFDSGFFRKTLKTIYERKDMKNSYKILELMTQRGIVLDMSTYNTMIGVFGSVNPIQVDLSHHLLDEMTLSGAFLDSRT